MSANTPVIKHWYERPSTAFLFLAIGLVLVILVVTGTFNGIQPAVFGSSNEANIEQGAEANVARYVAMGEWYGNQALKGNAGLERGNEAHVARYVAMGEWYANLAAREYADLQRGNEANVARYNAMADFYNAVSK